MLVSKLSLIADLSPKYIDVLSPDEPINEILIPEINFTIYNLFDKLQIFLADVAFLGLVGSRLYGNNELNSDYDFVLILYKWSKNSNVPYSNIVKLIESNICLNVLIKNIDWFNNSLYKGNIKSFEAILAPREFIFIYDSNFDYPNIENLKNTTIAKSEDDWCMATNEIKSIGSTIKVLKKFWHSYRILNFLDQLFSNKKEFKISNFSAANDWYYELITCPENELKKTLEKLNFERQEIIKKFNV